MTESPNADARQTSGQDRVHRTRRKKPQQSGFSLLARGEPQIWFTGGMLVVCLGMIVGLLALILYSGIPTFWTRQVDWLALSDGTMEIGQPQTTRREDDGADGGDESSGSGAIGEGLSRYYRTGNYDLTGRHYRWLAPEELDSSGISQPRWAMVVERFEWGRLYGLPLQLTQAIEVAPAERDTLEEISDLQQLIRSLNVQDSADLVDQMIASLEQQHADKLSSALRQSLDRNGVGSALVQVRTTEATDWQPYDPAAAGPLLVEARALWTESPDVVSHLQETLERVARLRAEGDALKHKISRLDSQLADLRVGVRRAELEAEVQVAQQVGLSHYLLERQDELSRRAGALTAGKSRLQTLLSGELASGELADRASALLEEYQTDVLPQEIEDNRMQLELWLEPIRLQPEPIVQAVLAYQAGFLEILAAKRPLEDALAEVERQQATTDVHFAIPNGPTEVGGLTDEGIDRLLSGRLDPSTAQSLSESGIDALADSLQTQQLGPRLQLVSWNDSQHNKHLLAVIETGYLGGDTPAERKVLSVAEQPLACQEIVRAIAVNQLSFGGKVSVYADRWREFLLENPRENTEGGVFPAIWGTIVMTLIMTIAVVPFGVMAALYLREYTSSGPLVSLIRISINNLAGVPSIVYGVFGFSFFCYTVGAYIDGGAKNADITPLPSVTWFAGLALVAILGTAAFFFGLFGGSSRSPAPAAGRKWTSRLSMMLWLISIVATATLILKSPFFDGFYREYLPNPTFGKGGLLWAALTLALLTLPVVIVATEEALSAVPNSLRQGSLACGASKWQTIQRIVLPHARPGILTGAILAMARGAGEVAPLMLVGALPSAPDLPLDSEFPYFHGSRSFMHLGYQIYTLGFQSPNSEAAKPMVFTCALLLILIVAALNIAAIYIRARLKRRFQGNQF